MAIPTIGLRSSWLLWAAWTTAAILAVVVFLWCKKRHEREKERRAVMTPVPGAEQWAGKRVCVVVNPIGGAGYGKQVFQKVLKPMLTQARVLMDVIGAMSLALCLFVCVCVAFMRETHVYLLFPQTPTSARRVQRPITEATPK